MNLNGVEKRERKLFLTIWIFLVIYLSALVQAMSQEKFILGLDFSFARPQAEFRQHIKTTPLGGGITLAYRPSRSAWILGFLINYLEYGREKRSEILSHNIPELTVNVVTTHSMLLGHVFVRFSPLKSRIQPYLEGLIGFNYLETETSIKNGYSIYGWYGWSSTLSSRNASDWTSSIGIGTGTSIRLAMMGKRKRSSPLYIYADMSFRYLWGGEAQYLKKGSIIRSEGTAFYHFYRSRTDLLRGSIALYLGF